MGEFAKASITTRKAHEVSNKLEKVIGDAFPRVKGRISTKNNAPSRIRAQVTFDGASQDIYRVSNDLELVSS